MRTLTLTDGTVYEFDWCNGDKGIFHANLITDQSFPELVAKFCNPELTRTIHCVAGDNYDKTFEGYTELKSVAIDGWQTGTVLITLVMPSLAA